MSTSTVRTSTAGGRKSLPEERADAGRSTARPGADARPSDARADRSVRRSFLRSTPGKLPRLAGLDGIRALAVAAVVAYHANPSWLPGGFLGVDVFFALSGYLITRLLVTEFGRRGRIRLGSFYLRRARRLLPAVYAVLGAVCISALFWRDQLATLRAGVLASATYVTNWWLIGSDQPYFVAAGRPSMVQHLWSLAIEEQFYLVWPMVLVAVMGTAKWSRRRRESPDQVPGASAAVGTAVVLAIAATVTMTVLAWRGDVPYGNDGSRIYYGTDTHSVGLLLGAAVGAWAARRPIGTTGSGSPGFARVPVFITDVTALAAVVALARFTVTLDEFRPELFRGGFAVIGLLAAAVAGGVGRQGSRLAWLLDRPPLRWLGVRSYGIYLWHWPIFVVTRPGLDLPWPTWTVQAFRIALTVVVAAVSYRYLEVPIREHGWRGLRRRLAAVPRRAGRLPGLSRGAVAASLALVAVVGASLAIDGQSPRATASGMPVSANRAADATTSVTSRAPSPTTSRAAGPRTVPTGPSSSLPPTAEPSSATPSSSTPSSEPTPAVAPGATTALAFGDSVMLGAAPALTAHFPAGVVVDAVEGRQARPVLADVRAAAAGGNLPPVVVLHVGDNGVIPPDDLRQTLDALTAAGAARVLVLTLRVDRPWQGPNNALIAQVVPAYTNARVVDWNAISAPHPEWFYEDGLHLRPDGGEAYATLLAQQASR